MPLAEADLSQLTIGNLAFENSVTKTSSIGGGPGNGSINNNRGIVGVNQSTGNFGNQANVVSVAAVIQ